MSKPIHESKVDLWNTWLIALVVALACVLATYVKNKAELNVAYERRGEVLDKSMELNRKLILENLRLTNRLDSDPIRAEELRKRLAELEAEQALLEYLLNHLDTLEPKQGG